MTSRVICKKRLQAPPGVSSSRRNPFQSVFVVQTSQNSLGYNWVIARNPLAVRGETRIPSFNNSLAAIRSSPQVTLALAISAIRLWRSGGTRGRVHGLDLERQNSRKPFRCHRMKVSGLTTGRTSRQANRLESKTKVNFVAGFARRGLTWRSRYRASCLRRKRFSAAKALRLRRVNRTNLKASNH